MKTPTFWTADHTDTIYEFLGECRAGVWQEYHEETGQLNEELKSQENDNKVDSFDDDLNF
jgi:hypothetical protein